MLPSNDTFVTVQTVFCADSPIRTLPPLISMAGDPTFGHVRVTDVVGASVRTVGEGVGPDDWALVG